MKYLLLLPIAILGLLELAAAPASFSQQSTSGTVPVNAIVSVEAKHHKDIPAISKEDVRVMQGKNRPQVMQWVPLQGTQAGLELLVLIDDSTSMAVATELDDIRHFIDAQPGTTAVGIGYLQNGTVRIVQNFSNDHTMAGKALRMPLGATIGEASPYLSVTDAIKRWPPSNARHAIILISDGIDALQPGFSDTYLDQAVERTQQSGTQIYAIYASRPGHFGHTLWRINQGQSNLSRLSDESGGEAYFEGLNTPVSFTPFLNEIGDRINHQYRLTFLAVSGKKPEYQHIKLETEVPDVELITADKIFVPAAK